jgi:DNA polymerase-3 subunit alpha
MALAPSDFAHLHVHSEYSLLDGANRIGALVNYVKELGQKSIALTDHGVMFGALEFYKACKKAEIKPIVGCEVYITAGSRLDRIPGSQKGNAHLLLLAMNHEGYKNLGKLSTLGHTEGFYYKPRIDFETLEKYAGGILATSSCMSGLIPRAIMDGNDRVRDDMTGKFLDIFGRDRFFVEIQEHGIPEQKQLNKGLIELATRNNLRVIATNDSHYLKKEDATVHDLLLCIQTQCIHTDPNRMRFTGQEFYVKSTAEMEAVFREIPESLTNTLEVADRCNLEMPKQKYHLPRFPCPDGKTEPEFLREEVWNGIRRIYGARSDSDRELIDRVEFELGVINKMGFDAYFLIVADFISHARSQGIPVGPGRGSAAGSVVAYSLGITQLCPLQHGLLFERFLNPDRLSMPDIDVDFCFERRGEVIEYVRKKYGENCVSQIITFGTIKAKLAVRDVGRVLGIPLPIVDQVAKLIPDGPKANLKEALEKSADLRARIEADPQIRQLMEAAVAMEGRVRHAGTHAAGIVIADQDLTEYCPLYRNPRDEAIATQFTMNQVEEIGLLKMDFLGIKNLTIIHRVETWLRERENITVDWDKIDLGDPLTYELLHKGQTAGVFQLESDGMTALVRAMQPTNFADLTALIALYRPGPLEAGMHTMYVSRKHGREAVAFDHPLLEPILGETFGTILYQEQVMRISTEVCGFTRGEADVLRKAMGKKDAVVMAKQEEKFIVGAEKKSGIEYSLAKHIWDQIVTFAGYGFNKSHSAAYAVITFRTAYLRAHYPLLYLAALLTNGIGSDTDEIAKYVASCREVGIEVMGPDVNRSREYFNPVDGAIYYALNAVKTVGEGLAKAIVAERDKAGTFRSLQDFFERVDPTSMNARMVDALVKVGAFDSLEPRRAPLVEAIPELLEVAHSSHKDRKGGQASLFEGLSAAASASAIQLPRTPEWDPKVRANFEKEFLGFFLNDHPLNRYAIEMESFTTHRSSQLKNIDADMAEGDRPQNIRVMGVITSVQIRQDKNGKSWAIVMMEDMDGPFELKFFSRSFEACRDQLTPERVVQVEARLSVWNARPSVEGQQVRPVEQLREMAKGIVIEWPAERLSTEALVGLKELCRKHQGRRPVRIIVGSPDGRHRIEFAPNGALRAPITDDALAELRKLPGRPKLRLVM